MYLRITVMGGHGFAPERRVEKPYRKGVIAVDFDLDLIYKLLKVLIALFKCGEYINKILKKTKHRPDNQT